MNPEQISVEIRPAQVIDADEVFKLLTQFVVSYRPLREKYDQNFPNSSRPKMRICWSRLVRIPFWAMP